MGTEFKAFRLILLLCLCSSFFLFTAAVPSSRSLINPDQHGFVIPQGDKFELRVEERGSRKIEGRMDIELTDYPGTGANPNHDPKNPGNSG